MNDSETTPRNISEDQPKIRQFRGWKEAELISNRWFVHRAFPPSQMGIIYFCFDIKLGQPMVAKSIPFESLLDAKANSSFVKECEIWVELGSHENITKAYFVSLVNGYPFVFVEWIDGKDIYNAGLDAWIGTPSLSIDRSIEIAVQICDGMSHAAEIFNKKKLAFVHGDIKPSNILITSDWRAKVTDFGIAKMRILEHLERAKGKNVSLMDYSDFLGTPQYMSPEHFDEPNSVDCRSDIYSFGCTLFEMMTGQHVFKSDSWEAWRNAHVNLSAPRLKEVYQGIPAHIDELVDSCLSKNPGDRPQSFGELKELLFSTVEYSLKKQRNTSSFSELMNKGTSLDSLGKFNEAIPNFDQAERALSAVEKGVEKTVAEFWLACNRAITFKHLGEFIESIKQWDKAAVLADNIPSGYRDVPSSQPLNKISAYLGKALTLATKGDIYQAIELCQDVLSEQPDNAVAISQMGYLLVHAEQFHDAISWCERAVQLDKHDVYSLANLGAALLGIGDIEGARSVLKQTLDLAPTHSPALYSMGTLLLQNESAEQAIQYLRESVKINPRYSEAWNHLGIALQNTNDPDCRNCFEQALRANKNNQMALRNLASVIQQEKYSSPLEALVSALISAGICESEQQVADYFVSQGTYSLALTVYEKILATDNSNIEGKVSRAFCLCRLERLEETNRALQELEGKLPYDFSLLLNVGSIFAEIGNVEMAISYYELALKTNPEHAATWCNLADILYQTDPHNLYDRALDCLSKAIQSDPELALAYGMKGRILDDLDRNEQALECYDRALKISPEMIGETFGRGLVLLKLERPIEAAKAFEKVYHLNPSSTQAAANQVKALSIANKMDEARNVLLQSLKQHPNDQYLISMADKLNVNF